MILTDSRSERTLIYLLTVKTVHGMKGKKTKEMLYSFKSSKKIAKSLIDNYRRVENEKLEKTFADSNKIWKNQYSGKDIENVLGWQYLIQKRFRRNKTKVG